MAHADLREFIRALDKAGELKRIPFEVDPHLEITEFADRAVKSGGPALLFEKAKGSTYPVLINAFASMKRMEIALGVTSVDEIAGRIAEMLEMRMPQGLIGKLKMLPKLADMANFFPKIVSERAVQGGRSERSFSLKDLPVLHCWPGDGGPLHHAADGLFQESGYGQAQLRHVSDAGLRRKNHGHALADSQARCRTLQKARQRRQDAAHGGGGGNRRGPRHDVLRDSAAATGPR